MASKTTTTTSMEAKNAPESTALPRNSKDSMKSTWRTWDRSRWNHSQWMMEYLGLHPTDLNRKIPVFQKTDKISYMPHSEGHKWILAHAVWPLVVHQAYTYYTGRGLTLLVGLIFYSFAFKFNAIREINKLRELGHQYGYFDGDKHERDQVPDSRTKEVMRSLMATSTIRPIVSVFLAYNSAQTPLSTLSWYLPLEIGLYAVILDFFFYWYHRVMHESDTLWKFHRTHHLSKHPSPVLSLYADKAQEVFDIIGIPIITYGTMRLMGLPMGFADWWICQQYIVWTELWGHSGLRVFVTPPTTATPFLKFFGAELQTEDHDLHHRSGWKKSHNYGKQTRLWDRLFGTSHDRIEAADGNIDWTQPISLSLW
ncbi:related to ERG25-C-4 methyl sterol oxidase [Rhynchosporium agropyri]|uniref:Related to ERG25-C-4 methyl sterol oxidase n=1 Tax=Rhynchosporium agropyri TaxID=914238 RepID=A0A1E1L9M4_9HELO|nr:related to ERG25-C-4 methyl sterol oxidase [Rhynchosporium agropyri]